MPTVPTNFFSAAHMINGPEFEPQRRNHYQLRIVMASNEDQQILTLSVVKAFMPNIGNEEIEVPWKNESIWVAGRRKMEGGTITVRDFVTMGSAQAIYDWRRLVFDTNTGCVGYARAYKKEAVLSLLGPDGIGSTENETPTFPGTPSPISIGGARTWTLFGLWPTNVNPGELSDESNEIVQMEVNLRFDNAIELMSNMVNPVR